MENPQTRLTDNQVENIIGNLLRIAVITAAVFVFIGGLVYLFRHGTALPDYQVFNGEPKNLRTIPGIIADSLAFHSRAIIQLGLVLLMATPVARVIFALFAFAVQRDRLYVVVTAIVLAVLVLSLAGFQL